MCPLALGNWSKKMSLSTPHIGRRIAGVTTALALTAGLGVAAIIVPSSASPVGAPNALDRSALGPNLIKNSGFKYGFKNWAKPKQDALAIVPGGVWGTQQAAAMK